MTTTDTPTTDTPTTDTGLPGTARTPDVVDADTVLGWLREPGRVTVVDVRTPAEYETAHVAGSVNVPLALLDRHGPDVAARLDRQVVLVCQSGARARHARRHLDGLTGDSLHVLDGGVPSLGAAGAEIVRGRPRWAMDRQVRLAAGSLVLASILVSLRVPAARLLAGGIGAGLTWSALSDTCALGNLLGRLPYNRGSADPSAREVLDRLPGGRS